MGITVCVVNAKIYFLNFFPSEYSLGFLQCLTLDFLRQMSHLCTWQPSINVFFISLSAPFLNSNKISVTAAFCSKKLHRITIHGVWSIFVHLRHLLVSSEVPCFLYQKRVNTVTLYLPCPQYLWFYRPASNPLPSSYLVSSPVNSQIKPVHHFIPTLKEGKKASINKEWEYSCVCAVWQKRTGYLYTHEINSILIYFSYHIRLKVL